MPLKVWNGSSYSTSTGLKVWNGSSWVNAVTGRIWNGSSWVEFYSGTTISIIDDYLSDFQVFPDTAQVSYELRNDGKVYYAQAFGSGVYAYDWVTPTSLAGNYQVRATAISGSPTSGTFNTWLNLSTSRIWELADGSGNPVSCSFLLEIRDTATSTIRDSATITMEVDVSG